MVYDSLTPNQAKAVVSLANGDSIQKVAAKIQVDEKTIDRWLKLPDFRSMLRQAVTDIYTDSLADSVRAASKAVAFLATLVEDESAPRRERIAAAKELLANASRWRELHLEERLERLECLLNGNSESDLQA